MSKSAVQHPEDSIALRVIVYCMTLTCIAASCAFIKTSWPVIVLVFTLCTVGSLVAYQYRYENQKWMQGVVIVGVLGVGANALAEFLNPMNGPADFWGPVVHFIAGTFALHTFDLKSRSDINLSAMLGALILCCLSPVARSIYFGFTVLTYISLGTMMLYYDCMSRTLTNWLDKPMLAAPVVPSSFTDKRRRPRGSAQLTLALLPFISILAFVFVPRSDDTIDIITSSIRNLSFANLLRLLPDFTDHSQKQQPARNPYTLPVRNLGLAKPGEDKDKSAIAPVIKPEKHAAPQLPEKTPSKASKGGKADKTANEADAKSGSNTKAKAKEKAEKEKEAKAGKDSKTGKAGKDSKTGKGGGNSNALGNDGKEKNALPPGIISAKMIDMDVNPFQKTGEILFKVSSTRLFWERRAVFDNFDGRYWSRSKDTLKTKNMNIRPLTSKSGSSQGNFGDSSNTTGDLEVDTASDTTSSGLDQANVNDPAKKAELEEAEAERQLEEERLLSLDGQLSGYGADNSINFVFFRPDKPIFDMKKANALIVPKIMPVVEITQAYEMVSDLDNVVPVCWIPQTVGLDSKKITVNDYGMVLSSDPINKGTTFKVVSQLPLYDTNRMRNEPGLSVEQEKSLRKVLANYLQLPEGVSPEVVDFANQAVGATGNWFSQADKLCHVMRTHAAYEASKPEGFAPAEDRVKQFLLERKLGNSQDFASAFVVLCRSIGLPARLVSGYGIGTTNKVSGAREVRTNDLHFWSEVFVPEYGWVPFDSVPDGILPAQAREEGYSLSAIQKMLETHAGMNFSDQEGLSPRRVAGWIAIIFSLLFLLAGIIFGLILFMRHLKRQAALNAWRGPEWKVYLAIIKDLKKIKIERIESESSEQFVRRVGEVVADRLKQGMKVDRDLPTALSEFFVVYEAVHFGNKELSRDLKQKASDVHKLIKSKGR
ncbi:MAG: transglutaminaseTgpA domain-containing protein [Candidatus Melainabacteria bacterium]|nr:transglutaminaseTgpA domain-containing protein [Candidatus Melainabacteria bacterium]